jgi:hypothetical protein
MKGWLSSSGREMILLLLSGGDFLTSPFALRNCNGEGGIHSAWFAMSSNKSFFLADS